VAGTATGQEVALEPPARAWYRAGGTREDSALIRQARRGSEDAVEALVRRHWESAHRAAFLIVHDAAAAEDIAQEAMLAAVRAIDRFDRRRPFRPWLHRIVVNRSVDWVRARARRAEVSVEVAGQNAGTSGDTAEAPDSISDELMRTLGALEPDDRALVVMRHVLGYRSSELGPMLGMPAATVRTRIARALARLRESMEEEAREDG
jgi:RNA polymerase sigma-70 factor, ECF subfamily